MATKKQVDANRQNALKSTGAKTKEGKKTVSKNRLKHGILSQRLILDGECTNEFQELVADLECYFKVSGRMEELLVERMAIALWRQKRLIQYESGITEIGRSDQTLMFSCIAAKDVSEDCVLDSLTLPDDKLEILSKYQSMLDNQLYRAINALTSLQQYRMLFN